ncbi:MAG: hypothetical protein HYY55_01630 [Candidatus Niyogibacteria bacterium]|nr:MAG: hypothetical protein HYY55_01630 [Candidatus Niyogibacteria bacterium]
MDIKNSFNLPVAIVVSALILGGAWIYTQKPAAEKNKNLAAVAPGFSEGTVLPVKWGDLGVKMISVGVIDAEKFESLYAGRGGLDEKTRQLLYGENNGDLKITPENSGVILNLLWALGLGNRNDILIYGPMTTYDGKSPASAEEVLIKASRFASTGGWTLAKGHAMEHYARHPFVILNEEQQELVERVSKNVYRPCCSNSTYFPDCNHGMAMLGLLELMASQGVGEKEMYDFAAKVNAMWFPELNQDAGSPCAVDSQPQSGGCAI